MNKKFFAFMAASMVLESTLSTHVKKPKKELKPVKKPIPKGCDEYFFSPTGDVSKTNTGSHIFKCVALNQKSAIRKFNNYLKTL